MAEDGHAVRLDMLAQFDPVGHSRQEIGEQRLALLKWERSEIVAIDEVEVTRPRGLRRGRAR